MDNRTRYIPALVMLMAGFLVCVVTIINDYSTRDMMLICAVVMIAFFVIGSIVRYIVERVVLAPEKKDNKPEETEEKNEGEQS